MAGELILIVEDNEKNRKLERDILQFHGYRTAEADNAEDGIALAQATPPALVLMDIQLPRMNGIEALQALRSDERTRAIPVIAVTASAMTQDRQKIMAAGFDGYQAKPIDVTQFVAAVRAMLDRPASERAVNEPGPHPGGGRHADERQAARGRAGRPRATR